MNHPLHASASLPAVKPARRTPNRLPGDPAASTGRLAVADFMNDAFDGRSKGMRRWQRTASSWVYTDVQGTVLGRIDQIGKAGGEIWFWWQTAWKTGGCHDMARARRQVELSLVGTSRR